MTLVCITHLPPVLQAALPGSPVEPACLFSLKRHNIPLHLLGTRKHDAPGTVVTAFGSLVPPPGNLADGTLSNSSNISPAPTAMTIAGRADVTLLTLDTPDMWQQVRRAARVRRNCADCCILCRSSCRLLHVHTHNTHTYMHAHINTVTPLVRQLCSVYSSSSFKLYGNTVSQLLST